jgi:hypothetical protein
MICEAHVGCHRQIDVVEMPTPFPCSPLGYYLHGDQEQQDNNKNSIQDMATELTHDELTPIRFPQ